MSTYEAFLNGRRIEVQAESLYAAKLAAVAILKPRKSETGLLAVVLTARADGSPVTVPTDF